MSDVDSLSPEKASKDLEASKTQETQETQEKVKALTEEADPDSSSRGKVYHQEAHALSAREQLMRLWPLGRWEKR